MVFIYPWIYDYPSFGSIWIIQMTWMTSSFPSENRFSTIWNNFPKAMLNKSWNELCLYWRGSPFRKPRLRLLRHTEIWAVFSHPNSIYGRRRQLEVARGCFNGCPRPTSEHNDNPQTLNAHFLKTQCSHFVTKLFQSDQFRKCICQWVYFVNGLVSSCIVQRHHAVLYRGNTTGHSVFKS